MRTRRRRTPARSFQGNLPNTSKTATIEPEGHDAVDNVKTEARERLHGGMQIFVETKGLQA